MVEERGGVDKRDAKLDCERNPYAWLEGPNDANVVLADVFRCTLIEVGAGGCYVCNDVLSMNLDSAEGVAEAAAAC